MSVLHHDGPRCFSRSTSARTFPESYYNERNMPFGYSRAGPYAYPMGGPVSGLRAASRMDREEFQAEQGASRRRIAIACARCRKRKIRCTGDKGDGLGCQSCRQAGVDASECQFHRVGSDNVHKIMDNFNIAQSLANMASAQDLVPMYSTGSNTPYHRGVQGHQHPQPDTKSAYPNLDAKSAYTSDWTVAYGEDTSPVDSYTFEQSAAYLPAPTPAAGSSVCGPSYRWTHPASRSMPSSTGCYSDYGQSYISNSLPYLQTDLRPSAADEAISPLNMSSLQLTLPERPRQRQLQPIEAPITPRRRLPVPQPNPSHGLHHTLDQQQDQRLRSSQTMILPSFSNPPPYNDAESFTKPLLPWTAANENLINAVSEATTAAFTATTTALPPKGSTDSSLAFVPTSSASNGATTTTGTAPSSQLSFNTSALLDPSSMDAPTPTAYSNFRQSRDLSSSSTTGLPRNSSLSNLYSFDSENASRRASFAGDGPSSNLVSGHRYTPLSQSTDTTSLENISQEPLETRSVLLHRDSMPNINSSF